MKPKQLVTGSYQEIIKVTELIPNIGPKIKVIPLKLFLDIVPSSSADIIRALRGCCRDGSVYMHVCRFRFVSFQSKGNHRVVMSSFTSKGASALGILYK